LLKYAKPYLGVFLIGVMGSILFATSNAALFEMRGRSMRGWLRVDSEDLRTKRQLAKWVELGVAYARSLPAKRPIIESSE